MTIDVAVSAEPFDLGRLHEAVENSADKNACKEVGAIASFVGKVRQQEPREGHPDQSLEALEIEHYPAITQTAIEAICEQARLRWPFMHCIVRHRVGRLGVGEDIVAVLVASSHRREAFEACEYIMDYLKTEAPFWKKAIYSDGAEWVAAKSSDEDRRQRWQQT